MDNKNEDKRKLRYNKNTHELDLIDMEEDLIDMEDDNTTRLSFFERLKVILIRNEIIYKTIFTLFGTMMTIALTYAGVKVASMANTIAKEQVDIQSREIDIALNEKLPFFEIIRLDEIIDAHNFICDYGGNIDTSGDIVFDMKKLIKDFESEFYNKYGASFVDCYNFPNARDLSFYIDNMDTNYYSEMIFSLAPDISTVIKDILVSSENDSLLNLLQKDINKKIRRDVGGLQVLNKGGSISNAVVEPIYILDINITGQNKECHNILKRIKLPGKKYSFNYDNVTIKTLNSSYTDHLICTLENELSNDFEDYDIYVNDDLYLNIEFQDFLKKQHDELYQVGGTSIIEVEDEEITNDIISAKYFSLNNYTEELVLLKTELSQIWQ